MPTVGLLIGKFKGSCFLSVLGSELLDHLIGKSGGQVRLLVKAQEIDSHDCWLTAFNSLMGLLGVGLEVGPVLVGFWLIVPCANVSGKDGGAADSDHQADVD